MASKKYKVYLAGPDVFKPNAKEIGDRLKKLCNTFGLEGMFPFDNELDKEMEAAKAIFEANKKMIEESDMVLANLNPFRGPSADPGTVWEVAYALGLGKEVVGYRSPTVGEYKDRANFSFTHDDQYKDIEGNGIEDFGLGDNLMIDMSVVIYDNAKEALQDAYMVLLNKEFKKKLMS